jgi:polysaccharide export outer membrane protein
MKWTRVWAILGVAMVLGGAARAQAAAALRPGDAVRLQIWREPDLSGDFSVDEFGVVVFPKIGPMRVTAQAPDTLTQRLVRAYAIYLNNPSVRVQMLRRIQVIGAVDKPGLYSVDPTMSVADAIALAGGINARGKSDKLELRRGGKRVIGRLSSDVLIGNSPIQSGDQLYVPERSWASRNPAVIIGALGLVSTMVWRFTQ